MILIRIKYYFQETFKSLIRNPLLSFINIMTVFITVLIFSSFSIIFFNLKTFFNFWGKELQVIVYINKDIDQNRLSHLKSKLFNHNEVEAITFTSKKEAMNILMKAIGGGKDLFRGINEDLLPASFEVKLKPQYRTEKGVKGYIEKIKGIKGIEDIQYNQEWIQKFNMILVILKFIGIALGGLLFFGIVFVISSTIRLSFFSRQDEIEIMRLVGATNAFIKVPFYIWGAMQALFGAGMAIIFLKIFYIIITSRLVQSYSIYLGEFKLTFLPIQIWGSILIGALILGWFGSFISIRRFLKI
ncbi:MAG: hypothetical protein DRG20_03330 [Deltaproteobacteria bacterium]|nr:MAG: hypothetical protein DRG20_03330 [Deltaproteobacteria bacterium]